MRVKKLSKNLQLARSMIIANKGYPKPAFSPRLYQWLVITHDLYNTVEKICLHLLKLVAKQRSRISVMKITTINSIKLMSTIKCVQSYMESYEEYLNRRGASMTSRRTNASLCRPVLGYVKKNLHTAAYLWSSV